MQDWRCAGAPIYVLVALLATACASSPESGTVPAADAPAEAVDGSAVVRHSVDDPEVTQLWNEAETARETGDYTAAVALLESAVARAPDDPVLLSRLAEMQLHAGDVVVAENTAVRSNAIDSASRLLQYRNWIIIAEARGARGDHEGMTAARNEAARLQDGD